MEIWVYGWTTRIVFLLVVWLTRLIALLWLVRLEVDTREEGTCAPDVASLPVVLFIRNPHHLHRRTQTLQAQQRHPFGADLSLLVVPFHVLCQQIH